MRLSEAVESLIRLGDASRVYWDRELPRHHPHYPVVRDGEALVPPPPEDQRIKALLESLPEDQVYALALLAYVGRGDFSADRLAAAYQTVKDIFPSKDLAIAHLTEEKSLAEYLADALDEIGKRHINLDSFRFAGAVAVS